MSVKLNKKQTIIINYISDFTEERGFSPSYREIMAGVGLSSVSAVAEHIDNLVKKGALKKSPSAARSLEVVDTSYPETVDLFRFRLQSATPEESTVLRHAADILGLDL